MRYILTLLIALLSNETSFARIENQNNVGCMDTLIIHAAQDTSAVNASHSGFLVNSCNLYIPLRICLNDTTSHSSVMHGRKHIYDDWRVPYNKKEFKFNHDPFHEKMKEPWLGDLLKELIF